MDRKQLVTIAVTALITVIVKGLFNWLLSVVKAFSTNSATKEKLRNLFNKTNRSIIVDLLMLGWFGWQLIRSALDATPITRGGVLLMMFSVVMFFVSGLMLMIDLYSARRERRGRAQDTIS
jgi:hypothetical protein